MSEILFFIPEPIFFFHRNLKFYRKVKEKEVLKELNYVAYKLRNQATLLVMRVRVKVPLRAECGNLLEKMLFIFTRLLHSARNDSRKASLNY